MARGSRAYVDVGTLTHERRQQRNLGGCRDIVYDPLMLPARHRSIDDPMLSARSRRTAVSYRRRAGEPPGDSAHPRSPSRSAR
jgi:catalase